MALRTVVNHVLLDAANNPQTQFDVTVRLLTDGLLADGTGSIISAVREESSDTGLVSFNLVRSSQYVSSPAVYEISWADHRYYFTVPDAGPVNLRDVITTQPTAGVISVPVTGAAGLGISPPLLYNAGTGLVTVNYTDGTSSTMAIAQGTPGAAGTDSGYADVTASTYAGGAVAGPNPATDPALSINAAIANAAGKPARVPPGTYYCQSQIFFTASSQRLHLMEGATLVRDFTSTSGWGNGFITHGPLAQTVKLNDLQLTGPGRITTAAGDSGGMVALYGDRQRHSDYTIDAYEDSLAWTLAGDQIRVRDLRLLTPRPHFNANTGLTDYLTAGGMRFCAGKDFVATDCHIVSGDDSLQAVPMQATFSHPFANQPIDGVRYIGCTGRSIEARFMAVVLSDQTAGGGMTCNIQDVKFIGCSGYGGQRGIAVRNDSPSTGFIEGVSFTDCLLDQSLATLDTTSADCYVYRATGVGAVRDVTFTRLRVRASKAVSFRADATATEPIDNLQIHGGRFSATAAALHVMDISGCTDPLVEGVTFDGGGTTDALIVGTATKTSTNARIRDCRFLSVPGVATYYAVNLNAAPDAQVTGSRFAGGLAATSVRAVRIAAASVNVLVADNNVTSLLSNSYWLVLDDTRLYGNVGDALDPRVMTVREEVAAVAAAGTAQTLPDPTASTEAHITLSGTTCAITVWSAQAGLSSSLTLRQHATLTGRLATWLAPAGTTIKWGTSDGNPPVLSTAVNKEDHFTLYCDRAGTLVIVPGPMGL